MMERCTVALSRAVRRGQTASRWTLRPDSERLLRFETGLSLLPMSEFMGLPVEIGRLRSGEDFGLS